MLKQCVSHFFPPNAGVHTFSHFAENITNKEDLEEKCSFIENIINAAVRRLFVDSFYSIIHEDAKLKLKSKHTSHNFSKGHTKPKSSKG